MSQVLVLVLASLVLVLVLVLVGLVLVPVLASLVLVNITVCRSRASVGVHGPRELRSLYDDIGGRRQRFTPSTAATPF